MGTVDKYQVLLLSACIQDVEHELQAGGPSLFSAFFWGSNRSNHVSYQDRGQQLSKRLGFFLDSWLHVFVVAKYRLAQLGFQEMAKKAKSNLYLDFPASLFLLRYGCWLGQFL